jgi:glycosyltransferase involved in cell wall biosynthesis
MPVYNGERYLREAVDSILNQSFGDFELLILDGGSTDGSPAILRDYAARDPRIRLTSRPGMGLTASLNEMLDQARGEFIARMDADDISLPERLERQVQYLRGHPECVLVGSAALVIDPEGDPLSVWFTETTHEALDSRNLDPTLLESSLCHPAVMMRRRVVLDAGRYDPRCQIAEDLDLWLRLAERGRLANLPEPLLKYRYHGSNKSSGTDSARRNQDTLRQIIVRARRRRGLPEQPSSPLPAPPPPTGPESRHALWAWQALGGGHVRTARKHARRLVLTAPFSGDSWRLLYCTLRGR